MLNISDQLKLQAKELLAKDNDMQNQLKYPRIFVDNDGTAFFDAKQKPSDEEMDISKIIGNKVLQDEGELFNEYVPMNHIRHYKIGNYSGELSTVSVTGPCIVFAAFTAENNDGIRRSGVYHAQSSCGSSDFLYYMYMLMRTVKGETDK